MCHCSSTSTVSRVVPGSSLTITRSSRTSRLTSDDLPTFGRPTMAIAVSSVAKRRFLPGNGQAREDLVQQLRDAVAMLGRHFDHGIEAHLKELEGAVPGPLVVRLVDGQNRRPPERADPLGDLLIARDQPLAAVDDEHDQVRLLERPESVLDHELVQRVGRRAEQAAGIDQGEASVRATRPARERTSRVVPAMGATIDRRVPVMRLKRVDLPTFGRPTSTTSDPCARLAIPASVSFLQRGAPPPRSGSRQKAARGVSGPHPRASGSRQKAARGVSGPHPRASGSRQKAARGVSGPHPRARAAAG